MVAHEDSRVMKEGQQEEVERCATTWKNSPYMASITRRAKEIHISAPALSTSNYLCCCLTCSLPKEHTKACYKTTCSIEDGLKGQSRNESTTYVSRMADRLAPPPKPQANLGQTQSYFVDPYWYMDWGQRST